MPKKNNSLNENIDYKYYEDFRKNILNNEEAIISIYHYLKTFPIEDYVPNRDFQKYNPNSTKEYI